MAFQYPAKSLFDASGAERVVWSDEEFTGALASGWSETKPETAVAPAEVAEVTEPKKRKAR